MKLKPHEYQIAVSKLMIERPELLVLADPGLGKTLMTLIALTAFKRLWPGHRTLLVAPLSVIENVWPQEIAKWSQFNDLTYSILHGKNKDNEIRKETDIHFINPEGLEWLYREHEEVHYETLVIDEISKFKSWKSKRYKILKPHLHRFTRRYGLTATPAPNALLDLFSQAMIVDMGKTFTKSITKYKNTYFYPSGYKNYQWTLIPGKDQEIYKKVAGISVRLDKNDHLNLPPIVYNTVKIQLLPAKLKAYKKFERLLEIDIDGQEILSKTALTKHGQCKQLANGHIFDSDTEFSYTVFHDEKIKRLVEFIDDLQGKQIAVAYQYDSDIDRLKKFFKGRNCLILDGGMAKEERQRTIKRWNQGKVQILFCQPKSSSHGLNLQHSQCQHVAWFSLPDDLDQYEQFNARFARQGNRATVHVHHFCVDKTVDLAIESRLGEKSRNQKCLLDAVKEYLENGR